MKIIDLLNKIANGEEVPKEFIWDDRKYYLQSDKCYKCDETSTILEEDFIVENLNDEVEIIEEKKIPEKFRINYEIDEENTINMQEATMLECDLACKINEIIDYLKSKGDE